MTLRERWMLAGLIAAFLGLAALGVWNQARHQDVAEAVRRYVSLDERQEKESAENAALLRQARPEIRRNLSSGQFEAALKRLKALEEEDAGAADTSAKALALGQLWPAGSAERARLKGVLQDLVRKQSEGFDLAPAQQKLVEMAQAARAGKRDEALAAFEQAANMVRDAPLRPGFKPKVALAAATSLTGGITPAELQFIEKTIGQLRALRANLPQALLNPKVTPQQRHALEAAAVLFDEMIAAHDQKRDLRPVLKVLDPLKKSFDRAGKTNEWGEVEQQIQAVRTALKSLPLLPSAATVPTPAPLPTAPSLPPVGPGPGAPPAVTPVPPPPNAAGIMQVLDFIRALPEEKYQAEKARIGGGIAQMLAAGRAGANPAGGETIGKDLQLVLGPQGEMRGLRLFGAPVATVGNGAGGVSLQVEGQKAELPIRAPLTREQDTHRFRVENPQGAVSVVIKAGQGDLALKVSGRRAAAGGPAFLNVSIPAQLGGWYWIQGGEPQPMAVDKDYRVQSAAGALPRLMFRSGATELSLDSPTASEAGYRPEEGRIWIRLPLTDAAGVAEHTVRLVALRRSP
ncbi:MAG: hypothetical protein ACO1SX_07465 [Actinomycetota bacterium]